jgi:hypothetical protein
VRRSAPWKPALLPGNREAAPGFRPGLSSAAGLALFALLCAGASAGCAAYAQLERPAYGKAWAGFAAQASSAARTAPPSPPSDFELDALEKAEDFRGIPQAQETARRAAKVLRSKKATREEIKGVMDDLAEVEQRARVHVQDDPVRLARLRATLAALKRRVEEKLLEISRIQASFDLSLRGRVRVAVVKIGEGVDTVREEEKGRWREFLHRAGFSRNAVFIPGFLAGESADAAAVRTAGARLGADAVLAYTTFAATTESLFGESAAVLSFAKCMFVDTRTEYLYFNAEGESHRKRVGVPFTVCPTCLEEECVAASVDALFEEIMLELRRLTREGSESSKDQ